MNWESGSEPAEAFEHCSYGKMIYKSRIFMDVPYFAGEFLSLCNLSKQQKHKEQQSP